jgi:hypothetical protein
MRGSLPIRLVSQRRDPLFFCAALALLGTLFVQAVTWVASPQSPMQFARVEVWPR